MQPVLKFTGLLVVFNLVLSFSVGANEMGQSLEYRDALIKSHGHILLQLSKNIELQQILIEADHRESSLMSIILKDLHWKEDDKARNKITNNSVSKLFELLIGSSKASFSEFMLTDAFGSLLASFPVTSDYWQGDERKFIQPIKRQGLYISDPNWDDSTNVYSFFLSIPIMNNQDLLGVLVAGIDVSSEYMMNMSLQDLLNLPAQENLLK